MVRSFLGVGANMSVLAQAGKDTVFDETRYWKKGYGWEQFLAWQVWKRGYSMVLNPRAQVEHILCGRHLTGSLYALGLKDAGQGELEKTAGVDTSVGYDLLREKHLFFFRLYRRGSGLSLFAKFCSAGNDALDFLKRMKNPGESESLRVLLVSNLIGLRWLLSQSVRLSERS